VKAKLHNVAVIIPALNEAESLPHVLRAMPIVGAVFVVDNGSSDATAQVATAQGATVLSEPERGYGRAAKTGIDAACAAGHEIIVILDADHSFKPEEMEKLVTPIQDNQADMVLGDRSNTAELGALTLAQRFGNQVATTLIYWVSGHRYADMGPFRAIRASSLIAMEMEDPNYGWNVEMQIKAIKLGFRVKEVDVSCRARIAGASKISGNRRAALRCGARMILATWHYA
jgi:glycosyltransferase involved in cell wall biosynthesis